MSETYTGFRQLDTPQTIIDTLYAENSIEIWDRRFALYPNLYLELKSQESSSTALARVMPEGQHIQLIKTQTIEGLRPRNREQIFALDALLDPKITVVVFTGQAGTGKTILTLGAALHQIQLRRYEKIILTRPMSEVGKYRLGALPGDASEKFSPYLDNYFTNLEQVADSRFAQEETMRHFRIQITPLQLIRGASFNSSLVIADEMQVCSPMEVLTLGTRIGEGSKVVIMGDLHQRDEKIKRDQTGIHRFINNRLVRESPLVATLELQKCERSETARLFASVFQEEE